MTMCPDSDDEEGTPPCEMCAQLVESHTKDWALSEEAKVLAKIMPTVMAKLIIAGNDEKALSFEDDVDPITDEEETRPNPFTPEQ